MATAPLLLQTPPPLSSLHRLPFPQITPPQLRRRPNNPSSAIICGPRDNRGPLIRGRTLSTEAILAIQALKRTQKDPSKLSSVLTTTLPRLIKADLLSVLGELNRQNQPRLALSVFLSIRRELWYDLTLYADMIVSLARHGMETEIDASVVDLMAEMESSNFKKDKDTRGLAKVVKSLITAGKGEAVREIYGVAKRTGWELDEFLYKLCIRGLRKLDQEAAADEVERDYKAWLDGGVVNEPIHV